MKEFQLLKKIMQVENKSRIANELSKINEKKADVEKLYTVIMNEYRDKSSQLTTLQTQDNREKSQSKSFMMKKFL